MHENFKLRIKFQDKVLTHFQDRIIKMKILINNSNVPYCFEQVLRISSFACVFVAYASNHLLFSTYSLISNKRKKRTIGTSNIVHRKIKAIALFNLLHENFKLRIKFQDKILIHFHSVLISCAKSNTRIAMGMTPNCSARYEITFRVLLYLLTG